MKSKLISGVVPPLVTPLLGGDHLGVNRLDRLIEHILNGGTHGLFVLGTTEVDLALKPSFSRVKM